MTSRCIQARKASNDNFGMKAHIGVDAHSGLVHTVHGISGNMADVTEVNSLPQGEEIEVFSDAPGQTQSAGQRKKPSGRPDRPAEKIKVGIRAKVEHPFKLLKRQFGYTKVRHRELKKNTLQITTLFALSTLWMAKHKILGSLE